MILRDWLAKWRSGFMGKPMRHIRRRRTTLRDVPEGLEVRELLSSVSVIIDNGDPGYYDVRTWQDSSSSGYDSDIATAASTEAGALASWTFTGLENGQYYLQATWTPGNNASNATFTARSEFGAAGREFTVDQRFNPVPDDIVGSTPFQTLGVVTVRNGSLTVELTNRYADGLVVADAVRLEPVLSTDNSVEVRTERLDAITKALFAFQGVYNHLPPVATPLVMDANGKFPLSWRVHLLPFLGYDDLYRSFHLNEPWNSPHNLTLLNQMPDVFRSLDLPTGSGLTGFQRIDVPGGFHITGAGGPNLNYRDISDNPATSLLVLELSAGKAVPWTAPDDVPYSPLDPLASIIPPPSGFMLAAMADGKIQRLNRNISADDFHALVTWNGKEILSADRLDDIFLASTLTPDQISQGNLKAIYLGMFEYVDEYGSLPPWPKSGASAAYFNAQGNPYLSWRVHILPYIGEEALYKKFKLNEPWDSPNNLPLAALMPEIFRSTGISAGNSLTGYQIFNGPGAYSSSEDYFRLWNVVDGYAHTLSIIELPVSSAKVWTRPDGDISFNSADPLAGIAPIPEQGLWAAMFDGSVRKISPQITAANMLALATWQGNEVLSAAELSNAFLDYPLPESIDSRRLKLNQLGWAFWNYYDIFREFPVTAYNPNMDSNGRAKLSWRVYLLPYLGYSNLFNQFHLNEAWDSPHNLTLLDKMPEVYRSRGIPVGSHLTGIQLLIGPDSYRYSVGEYGSAHGPTLNSLYDGLESTILAIETQASQAVEWTRPDGDLSFDLAHPLDSIDLSGLENSPANGLLVLMVDGYVKTLQPDIAPEDFAALVTWKQGEVIDAAQKDRSFYEIGGTFSPEYNEFYRSQTTLRNISIGLLNYHEIYGMFPVSNSTPNFFGADGKPKLSWRVHILPWIGEVNLYNQFRLDESWDSPNNLPLLDKMPEIFLSRGLSAGSNLTGFQFITSEQSYISTLNKGSSFRRITDDITIGVIETPPEFAVPWSKPDDFPFNPTDPFADIRALVSDYIAVMFMNASARAINPQIAPADAAALITWRGGEVSNYEYSSFATNYELRSLTPQIRLTDSSSNRYRNETDVAQLGSTPLGTPLDTTFTIKNTGSQPLVISSIQLPAGFLLLTSLNSIAPNASAALTIRLDPTIGGNFGGIVTINSNVPDQPVLKFTIDADVTSPLGLTLDHASVDENLPIGTIIGTFSTTGSNPGNTFAYTLVSGKGSGDNAFFTINSAGQLQTTASFNFENRSSYSIRVRTTEQETGISHERAFTIDVLDIFDPPAAQNDTASTTEDTPTIIDVLGNDIATDTPRSELRIIPGTLGYRDANGLFHPGTTINGSTISIRADGRIDYIPAPNFDGQDTFEYALSDGIIRILSVGNESQVNSSTQGQQEFAQVAMDADGDYIVVWTSYDAGYPDYWNVYAQRYDSSGIPLGSQFRVNQTTEGEQRDAVVAMDAQGNFVIVWVSQSTLDWQESVVAQWFDASGERVGPEKLLGEPRDSIGSLAVSMNRNGESVVAWSGADNSQEIEFHLFAQRFARNGLAFGNSFQVDTADSYYKGYPSVAMADDGSFVLVWEVRINNPAPHPRTYKILGQLFDSSGAKAGNEFQLNDTANSRSSWPKVAMNSSGKFVVTWSTRVTTSGNFNVLAQQFNSDGTSLGAEILVHSVNWGDQLWSQVAMHDDGSFVISWEAEEQENNRINDVFLRRFDAQGSPLHDEFRVNSTTLGDQWNSDIAMDDRGNFIIVWDSDDDLDDDYDIFMQRFETLSSTQIGNVTVNVTPVNDPPTAVDDTATTPEDTATIIDVLTNDADPDTPHENLAILPGTLGYRDSNGVFHPGMTLHGGSVTLRPDGRVNYTPASNFNGQDSFEYETSDGNPGVGTHNTFQVNSTSHSHIGWFPTMAMNAQGLSVVVWNGSVEGGYQKTFAQFYDAAGTKVGGEIEIDPSSPWGLGEPQVAMDAEGGFVMIWAGAAENGNLGQIYGRKFDPSGYPTGDRITISSPGAYYENLNLTLSASGHFVASWQTNEVSAKIWARYYDQHGSPLGEEFLVSSGVGQGSYVPRATFTPDGGFFLAWANVLTTPVFATETIGQKFDSQGAKVGGEFKINSEGTSQLVTSIALAPDGNIVVLLSDFGYLAGQGVIYGDVYLKRISSLGENVGETTRVNTLTENIRGSATLTVDSQGDIIVAWGGRLPGTTENSVWYQRFNSVGEKIGLESRISDSTPARPYFPTIIAADANGNILVTWIGNVGTEDRLYGHWIDRQTRGQVTINVTPVNDAPILNNNGNPTFDPITLNIPDANNSGTLVTDIIARMSPNGGITDPDFGALQGIAINGLGNTATGTWQFTIDGGTTWLPFGPTGNANGRLLAADALTRIRYVPNTGFLGEAKIAFVAWDQTTGTNGGTAAVGTRGGSTPYSATYEYASLSVVNSGPVLNTNGNPALDSITINIPDAQNSGTLISYLISRMAPNGGITDPNPNALQGIAINGLGGTSTGIWEYTVNNGTNWTPIATTGNSNARLLAADSNTRIRYRPNPGFLGEAKLAFVAWDRTTGANGGIANVNNRGGTTAFSINYEYASLFVVNNAPVLNPTNASYLTSIPMNVSNGANVGTLVSDLITRIGPNGITDPNPAALQGIAINGLGGTSNGIWQYTINGGVSWSAIGTTGNSNARLLAANANTRIRFVPNLNFTGTVKLAFVAWDQTSGVNGGIANVSTRGGTTAFSALYDYASLSVV